MSGIMSILRPLQGRGGMRRNMKLNANKMAHTPKLNLENARNEKSIPPVT